MNNLKRILLNECEINPNIVSFLTKIRNNEKFQLNYYPNTIKICKEYNLIKKHKNNYKITNKGLKIIEEVKKNYLN